MPRRSEPAPGSVIAIAPTSSPRTSARHPGPPLLVVAVVEHVVRRDLVHALAEAREARVQELLVDDALEAEVAPEPAVLLRHVGAEQPGLPRAPPELGVDVPARLPGLVVGQDLALDPGPRGLAEELVLVARPGRAGPQGARCAVMRGSSQRACGGDRPRWHSRACAIWPTRRVQQADADPQPAPGRARAGRPAHRLRARRRRRTRRPAGDRRCRQRRDADLRAAGRGRRSLCCRAGCTRARAGRGRRHLRAQRAGVRRRVSRRRPRRRDEHDRQRALHGRRRPRSSCAWPAPAFS